MRGPGDFFGHRQHGLPTFRAANLTSDLDLLRQAQQAAAQWIEDHGHDNTAEADAIRIRVHNLFSDGGVTLN